MISETVNTQIKGSIRIPLLIMEWVILFLFLELAIIFWLRIINKKKALKNLQEKAYISILLGYAGSKLFYIIGDYYVDISLRMVFYNFAYLIFLIGLFFFIYTLEKYKIFIRKYLFTKILGVLIFFFISIFIVNIKYTQNVSYIFALVFVIFVIVYIRELYSSFYKKKELGNVIFDLIKFCLGIIFILFGYQLATDLSANIFGIEIRIVGDIFQLIGLFFLFIFFISIPSFSEYDWQEKIKSVIIMYKSGLFIYKENFQGFIDSVDNSITTGMITILKMMLETFTEKEGTSIIEKGGNIIIIQPGRYIIGAIICDEKLNSIQILLNKFIEKIETVFSHILTNWDGNLTVFKLIEEISKEIFH